MQQAIDPIGQQGDGAGAAPWFHVVDIYPVEETTINISAKFTLSDDATFEGILEDLKAAVDGYFVELNKTWEDETELVVRTLRVAERMGAVTGVVDVQEETYEGLQDAQKNIESAAAVGVNNTHDIAMLAFQLELKDLTDSNELTNVCIDTITSRDRGDYTRGRL